MRFRPLCAAVLLLCPINATAQASARAQVGGDAVIAVSGVVLDETTGEPLQGAVVSIRGLPIGMVTGEDGTYTLESVPNRNLTLRVSRLGYVPEARQLWVCTPDGLRSRCVPHSTDAQELRFYMRPTPARAPRFHVPSPPRTERAAL
jgi:hypothetical protein